MMCSVLRLLSFSNQTLVIDGCVVLYACTCLFGSSNCVLSFVCLFGSTLEASQG